MATFTDLSLSTQAGDPVVSILTSGLDRNQIAAFEGDPTATILIQAQNNAFTPDSITSQKLGALASGSSLAGVESIRLAGDWGLLNSGISSQPRSIARKILKSGTYRFVGALRFTSEGGGSTLGTSFIRLTSDISGILISSDTASTLNTWVYIDELIEVAAGETLTLTGRAADYDGTNQPQFAMKYKLFTDDPSFEAPKTVGWSFDRHREVVFLGTSYLQTPIMKHIDWTSTPYAGDMS
tara:strand:+ start:372 stop:1088 length:717 start_codon:yes stop_codon:yes gene_type:complete